MPLGLNNQSDSHVSITKRLMGLSMIIFIAALVGLTYFVNQYAKRAADSAYDKLLIASALTIAGAIQIEKGKVTVELPLAAFDMLTETERVFYSIRDDRGELITGYDKIDIGLPLMLENTPQFVDAVYHDDKIRIISLGHLISSSDHNKWITIRVAETTDAREILKQTLFKQTVIPMGCLMLIGLVLISIGLKYSLSPLMQLEKELLTRQPDSLEPLISQVPKEIQSLVLTLNQFIARLADAMKVLTNMVGDTAHQLKTPLASISAQAEVALLETDYDKQQARLIKIYHNANHASQLVHQILMDTTVSHRLENRILEPLTLDKIIEEIYLQISPDDQFRIHYELIIETEIGVFISDRIALREMIANLLQNALIYSPDQVELTMRLNSNGSLDINVSDRGPGIADSLKKTVFQRFVRGHEDLHVTGSGLGLSIVLKVVQAHLGQIELLDREGGGLVVSVKLPVHFSYQAYLSQSKTLDRKEKLLPYSSIMRSFIGVFLAGLFTFTPYSEANLASESLIYAKSLGLSQTIYELRAKSNIVESQSHEKSRQLVIAGTTDEPIFAHFIRGYLERYPTLSIRYIEMSTQALYEGVKNNEIVPKADIIISSAADLQLKLANDGFAQRYHSPYLEYLPKGTHWRSELFGFSLEPIVIVYNQKLIEEKRVPKTHLALIEMLEQKTLNRQSNWLVSLPAEMQAYFTPQKRTDLTLNTLLNDDLELGENGLKIPLTLSKQYLKVSTYDIEKSGVGYLIATQDAIISSDFWRLANALDSPDVLLQDNSSQILNDLSEGKIALAYNVLGAYAYAKSIDHPNLKVILPQDYVLVLPRTAMIAKDASNLNEAKQFIDFLLSDEGQSIAATYPGLGAMRPHMKGQWTPESIHSNTQGVIKFLELKPTLLVGLDDYKKTKFVKNWLSLVTK
ncbi:sensor histidine kinase [Thorsellia anophelis]|uniref:histidine kinase n=1 Tax=Thorsellia anophelis DSM 18579 TaxID=1123402 RepID=A0A1I0AGI5_9GAMM|nr:extracellular solute-binding protein [Thorsellia anophelis]SES92806.1 Signal transduction histidine kinase [Thorsellia anophelis DSM 18579]